MKGFRLTKEAVNELRLAHRAERNRHAAQIRWEISSRWDHCIATDELFGSSKSP